MACNYKINKLKLIILFFSAYRSSTLQLLFESNYPSRTFLFHAHDILDFLDPGCHALWTHLESRLEVFRKTKALVILAQALVFLGQASTICLHNICHFFVF